MSKDEALKAAIKAMGNSNSISYEMMHAIADCKEALAQPAPPPECKTEAEQTAYAFGWWKALETVRTEQSAQEPVKTEPDWKDQYGKQKRRAEMWIAKYEKDIGPLEKAAPVAQEPVHNVTSNGRYSPLLTHMMDKRTAPQQQEPRNFCPRCGKRTADLTVIHTCTPPRGLEMT